MIWNLSLHTAAGYFLSNVLTWDSSGLQVCLIITAIVQGIDMFRIILEATSGPMQPQSHGTLIWKSAQIYVMKILFYGSITLLVAKIASNSASNQDLKLNIFEHIVFETVGSLEHSFIQL